MVWATSKRLTQSVHLQPQCPSSAPAPSNSSDINEQLKLSVTDDIAIFLTANQLPLGIQSCSTNDSSILPDRPA